jgi:hypothetical protein
MKLSREKGAQDDSRAPLNQNDSPNKLKPLFCGGLPSARQRRLQGRAAKWTAQEWWKP